MSQVFKTTKYSDYLGEERPLLDIYVNFDGPEPTPSITPTISLTPSITPTVSITPTISVTPTITPSVSPSIGSSPTPTPSLTPSPTNPNLPTNKFTLSATGPDTLLVPFEGDYTQIGPSSAFVEAIVLVGTKINCSGGITLFQKDGTPNLFLGGRDQHSRSQPVTIPTDIKFTNINSYTVQNPVCLSAYVIPVTFGQYTRAIPFTLIDGIKYPVSGAWGPYTLTITYH